MKRPVLLRLIPQGSGIKDSTLDHQKAWEASVQVQHRLIIRHPLQAAVLVVDDHGEIRLPAFTSDDRHTAEVDYINTAVHQRFGLLTTVLRSLSHSEAYDEVVVRVHELETHGDGALWSHTLRWYGRAELLSLPCIRDQSELVIS